MKWYNSILAIGLLCCITACENEAYVPKPRGYFRLALPNHSYQSFKKQCPYAFEFSTQALAMQSKSRFNEPCWYNIEYPSFNATIHLSYKAIEQDSAFETYTEDARSFVYKHTVKASGIEEHVYANAETKSFGIVYTLEGNTASPLQFYVTDSTRHFLRGALYFNQVPNEDSLKPVIAFLNRDIEHLVETVVWE